MKNRKCAMLLLMTAVMAMGSTGCGTEESASNELTIQMVEEDQRGDEQGEVRSPQAEATEHEVTTVGSANSQDTDRARRDKDELSDDWTDMEFTLDGESYQLPASYRDLEEQGWSFDLEDYGYEDGFDMEPGDMTYATVQLTNPDYDDELIIWVGFANTDNRTQDIKDCDIWSIELDTCLGFDQFDEYPEMEIAQGIGIGSTEKEVRNAFGEADDIYESDYGYVEYTYEMDDYEYELCLTIFEDEGVTAIEMNTFDVFGGSNYDYDEDEDEDENHANHDDDDDYDDDYDEDDEDEDEDDEDVHHSNHDDDENELSDDWTDMEFVLDGEYYQLPASYSDLEEQGWSFDLEDYGYEDGYVLNPGDKTYSTIQLTNPEYDDMLTIWVGFVNTSKKAQDITDCDIWSIELDTCLGFDQFDEYPDMEIAQGIGIGSTEKEVKNAFGECDNIYESDYGYVVYTYEVGYDYELSLEIYEDEGVTCIEISNYGL